MVSPIRLSHAAGKSIYHNSVPFGNCFNLPYSKQFESNSEI